MTTSKISYSKVGRLHELVKISKGKKYAEQPFGKNRYINIEDLHGGNTPKFTDDIGVSCNKNDVLIAWDGANAGKVGTGFEGVIGSTLAKMKIVDSRIDSSYLYWYLEAKSDVIKSQRTGATIPHVNGQVLKDMEIPMMALPTQKRIAEILDKADALRKKDQQLLKHYDNLAQSLFIDMFGDPVRNEKGWEVKSVANFTNCIVPGRDKPKSFTGSIPWVTTDDLIHLGFTFKSKKNIGLSQTEIKEVKAKVIPSKSVIMTCVGDLGVLTINRAPIVINQQLHAFQCIEPMNPVFLMYSLSYQKAFMLKMASSTTVPYMNKTVCNSVPTINPPSWLQNQFAEQIQNIEQQKEKLKAQIEQSENLFQALLQQAFNGG